MRTQAEKLMTDLKTVAHDAEELLNSTAGTVSGKADAARGRLRETIESARSTCAALQAKARDQADAARDLVRDRPFQSLAIAASVGLVVGLILGRKD